MRIRSSVKLIGVLALTTGLSIGAYAAHQPTLSGSSVQFLHSTPWSLPGQKWFGGLSGLSLSSDGTKLVTISDNGFIAKASLVRTDGQIAEVHLEQIAPLRIETDRKTKKDKDAEGLAIASDGSLFVAFERKARIVHFTSMGEQPQTLPHYAAFSGLRENKELEALAIDSSGRLYTLPEKTRGDRIPVWRWDDPTWTQPFSVAKRDGFQPVGADIGPDGRFYVLERKFMLIGFVSRLRRWDMTETELLNETILFSTGLGTHDNLEGLSVWRAEDNQLRATMISDNNYRWLQRTELVEYQLGSE